MPARKQAKPKKERKQVRLACVACRKAKTACDEQRPCHRCFTRGIENCVDAPKKSRSNKKSCITCRDDRHESAKCTALETFSKCSQSASPDHEAIEEVPFIVVDTGAVEVKPDCYSVNCEFLSQFLGQVDIDHYDNNLSMEYTPFGINVLGVMSIIPSFDQMLGSMMQ